MSEKQKQPKLGVKARHMIVSVALDGVIAALAAVILLVPGVIPARSEIPTDAPPALHEKLRDASAGKAAGIERETFFMGSGDESAVFVREVDGVTYIFGNATVADYDFDVFGGFLARLDENGRILGFTYFSGRLTAAAEAEGGFAVATVENAGESDEASHLSIIDGGGETISSVSLDGECVDIFSAGSEKIAAITKPAAGSVKLAEFQYSSGGLTRLRSTRISSEMTIDYLDCYYVGGKYVIAARAHSLPRYDSIVFYEFTVGGDATPHYYGGSDESMITPFAVLPYGEGYLAAVCRGGAAAIVSVDYSFMSYRRDMLGFGTDGGTLNECGGKYYACFETDGGYLTYELDGLLNRSTVSAAVGYRIEHAFFGAEGCLVGVRNGSVALIRPNSGGTRLYSIAGASGIFSTDCDGGKLIVLSATGGADVNAPVGGKDLYALKIV